MKFPDRIHNIPLTIPNHIQNYSVTYFTYNSKIFPNHLQNSQILQLSGNPVTEISLEIKELNKSAAAISLHELCACKADKRHIPLLNDTFTQT